MGLLSFCNILIEYSFYLLFILVPVVFTDNTSELFEFNKMWVTFILTIVICVAWATKMLVKKQIKIQKTPLDIPILLFGLSQIISTAISLDQHISMWGYYSRFNGGLLSTISYILLYYAFVSNFNGERLRVVKNMLWVTLGTAVAVTLWGLPSHFGHDPTCWLFRGQFNVDCWTYQFQPTVRMFSSLGQPDWLGAYLNILIPIGLAFALFKNSEEKESLLNKKFLIFGILSVIFYVSLMFTLSRASFVAVWVSLAFFVLALLIKKNPLVSVGSNVSNLLKKNQKFLAIVGAFVVVSFFAPIPIVQLQKFNIPNAIQSHVKKPQPVAVKSNVPAATPTPATAQPAASGELSGADSGNIRKIVWEGAVDIWKQYPIFGSGVETFAFAYYKVRPAAHNQTSEWDYLYNKAHNEYLNYLSTTGSFGFLTYMFMILLFFALVFHKELRIGPVLQKLKIKIPENDSHTQYQLIVLGLLASYLSILITDFFGFSVVITNLYLFLIPAFVFIYNNWLLEENSVLLPSAKSSSLQSTKNSYIHISFGQWVIIVILVLFGGNLIYNLYKFWDADKQYYLGYNYDKIQQFDKAYQYLHAAVAERSDEPTFSDELSINDAIIAAQLAQQKQTKQASQIAQEGLTISNQLTTDYPNNLLFWKTRTRIYYALAQVDSRYLQPALLSIQKAAELAPTDAKIMYNLGVLYGQTGDIDKGIQTLQQTVTLKPDYIDAHYALALFYRQKATNGKNTVIDPQSEKLAVEQVNIILSMDPNNQNVLSLLKSWGESR